MRSAKPQHSQGRSKVVGIGHKLAEKLHLKQSGQGTITDDTRDMNRHARHHSEDRGHSLTVNPLHTIDILARNIAAIVTIDQLTYTNWHLGRKAHREGRGAPRAGDAQQPDDGERAQPESGGQASRQSRGPQQGRVWLLCGERAGRRLPAAREGDASRFVILLSFVQIMDDLCYMYSVTTLEFSALSEDSVMGESRRLYCSCLPRR